MDEIDFLKGLQYDYWSIKEMNEDDLDQVLIRAFGKFYEFMNQPSYLVNGMNFHTDEGNKRCIAQLVSPKERIFFIKDLLGYTIRINYLPKIIKYKIYPNGEVVFFSGKIYNGGIPLDNYQDQHTPEYYRVILTAYINSTNVYTSLYNKFGKFKGPELRKGRIYRDDLGKYSLYQPGDLTKTVR